MKFLIYFFITILFFFFQQAFSQNENYLKAELVKSATRIEKFNIPNEFQFLKNYKLVLAGESTHGTHEFFIIKSNLFKYLVANCNFKIFALEISYCEGRKLNDYICKGKGDLKDILLDTSFWTWKTEEMLNLIQWMRSFNVNKAENEKIKFFGFDSGNGINHGFKELAAFFKFHNPSYLAFINDTEKFMNSPDTFKLKDSVLHKTTLIKNEIKRFKGGVDDNATDEILQILNVVEQNYEYYFEEVVYKVRDKHMADNIKWIVDRTDPENKVFIWAHNAHVSRSNHFYSFVDDPVWKNIKPMGFYISEYYPNQNFIINLDFGEGVFRQKNNDVIAPASMSDTFIHTFKNIFYDTYFVNFLNMPDDVRKYLHKNGQVRHHDTFIPSQLGKDFDGLIFTHKSTPSKFIQIN